MAINYTSLLGLVQPVDGTEAGTWGDDVNNGVSSILDVAVAGTQNITTTGNVTLTTTQATSSSTNLSSTSAQYAIILLSGARTGSQSVTLPSTSKTYTVINSTTGGYTHVVGGLNIAPGEYCQIAYNVSTTSWNKISNNIGSSALTTVGTIASGTWNGSLIGPTYGGTGVNNGSNTLTLAGNVTHAGAYTQTFTATGNTSITLPTSGTLLTTTGSGAFLTFGTGSLSLAGNMVTYGAYSISLTASANTSLGLPISGNLISSVTAIPAVTGTPSSTTYLRGDGTWSTVSSGGGGTVTSVAATVPSFLSISGSPITSSGTLAIGYSGTALPIANGGTGATTSSGALTNLGGVSTTGSGATGTWGISISGNAATATSATTATTATTATNATNVAVTLDSSSSTFYPTFVAATSGNNGEKASSTFTYVPSTGKLSSTIFASGSAAFYSSASYAVADGPLGFVAAVNSTSTFVVNSTEARPSVDNSISAGTGSFRYTTVYAVTGTINTSDARKKTAVSQFTDAEVQAAKLMSKEIGTFKWLDAIQKKGAGARTHIGLTVQRAMEIMQSCGLDPFTYGFICYDKWEDSFDPITGQIAAPAGDCYAFRYDELNLFIARGLEARLAALEAKV